MKYKYNYGQFNNNDSLVIKRGDVYFANLDYNNSYGSELRGVRPVLVISNDTGNKHAPNIMVAPITSQMNKAKLPTHLIIKFNEKPGIVFLEHIMTIDKDRLYPTLKYELTEEERKELDERLLIALGINL